MPWNDKIFILILPKLLSSRFLASLNCPSYLLLPTIESSHILYQNRPHNTLHLQLSLPRLNSLSLSLLRTLGAFCSYYTYAFSTRSICSWTYSISALNTLLILPIKASIRNFKSTSSNAFLKVFLSLLSDMFAAKQSYKKKKPAHSLTCFTQRMIHSTFTCVFTQNHIDFYSLMCLLLLLFSTYNNPL